MKYFFSLTLIFICSFGFSQNELVKEATTFLESNQVFKNDPKEKFFLHTNKTTYFSGEYIHYKAYIVNDDTNLPSNSTTNLHFSIYDSHGELIDHYLFFVQNGLVNGSIKLDEGLESGTYYIMLDTNYNASFKKKNISEIQVVNLLDKKVEMANENDLIEEQIVQVKDLQVAFFPESNMLLSRANNTLYYKISLNGLPLETKGELIKTFTGEIVEEFTSNADGLGSVNFDYYPDREYYFKILYDKKGYKINVPLAQKEGFVIHHDPNSSNSKETSFTVRINNDTAIKNNNETILAVIHRNDICRSVLPFKINKNINNYLLNIKPESLFDGVNIITLFNKKNEALSSRYFFYDKKREIELSINKTMETKDSLTIDLKMPNSYIVANTSVSILPGQNVINNNSNSIYNAFLIAPYVSKINSLENLDLNLQMQSPKNNILKVKDSVKLRNPENGISITGEVLTDLTSLYGYKILLTSKENNISIFGKIEKNNTFSFNNLLLYHPSKFNIALLSPRGNVVEAEFKVQKQKLDYPIDSLLVIKQNTFKQYETEPNKGGNNENEYSLVSSEEQLDEVLLSGKKRREVEVDDFPDFGIINSPAELGAGFTRRKVKDEINCQGCTLFEYLDQFSELKTLRSEPGLTQSSGYHIYFKSRGINTAFGSIEALLIIDGIPSNPSILGDIMAEDVKSVKLNRAGAGYGIRGSNGVVLVELKGVEDYLDSDTNNASVADVKIFSSETTFGFTKTEDLFSESNLIFNSQNSLEKYSAIEWIPNFILKPNSSNYITIPKESYTALKLIINGINEQGDLVSEEVNLTFN
ncbi:hypothetical protein [Bizionia arctica]|uniref:TonB-dependent receptor plug domain-containing protein n=1 Tax=Bizionia arctica TaxID=1495645 RepID=A0A917GB45_9FLAO|nr:hypothetical protein [Bizionia arctica]GGG34167.1 hypothetical protein GCM10010976_02340 [Bizionia arctica]